MQTYGPGGRTLATVNPFRVDCGSSPSPSVGFTCGYSWGGPSRGHIDLTFRAPNFCVANPPCAASLLFPENLGKMSPGVRE